MKNTKTICNECIHNRVCGDKQRYEAYYAELVELNKKYDIDEKALMCPEYNSKADIEAGLALLADKEVKHIQAEKDEIQNVKDLDAFLKFLTFLESEENSYEDDCSDYCDSCDCCNCGINADDEDDEEEIDEEVEEFLDELAEMIGEFIENDSPLDAIFFPNTTREQRIQIRAKIVDETLEKLAQYFDKL